MKNLLIFSIIFAFALVLLPPLDPVQAACNQTLTDVDDTSVVCIVNTRSVSRFNINQAGVVNFNQNIRLRTGRNRVIAGDDISNISVTSGNINFNQTLTSSLNVINLTIN